MQVLEHQPEIRTYSDETGDYISGFLIGTKRNDANWKINKETGHDQIRQFEGTDFAIIPELIKTPLSKGGGGHYFGKDTLEDLLKGYTDNSHGRYHKILGPYSYNDGTDDYFYNAIIKLRDSKAASELVKHGAETWVPYSISPHIWPLEGPDNDIRRWKPIGGALVIKGAFGPQAVISKHCKGTAVQCEKSLGASGTQWDYTNLNDGISLKIKDVNDDKLKQIGLVLNEIAKPCEQKDSELAEIISSFCSKSASSQISMPENKDSATPQVTTLTAEVVKPNATVNAQEAITNSAILTKVVTPEQHTELEKKFIEQEKIITELKNKDKLNTLNNLLIKVKDDKAKEEVIKKYSKVDNVDQIKEIINDFFPLLKASDEEDKPKEDEDVDKPKEAKAKSKGASLPAEPVIPKEETESKAASVPVNKLQEILRFQMSGGRA